ncbi:development-specific protein LVN1.2-like [Patiria miniata]|uniref:Uncharacterized protein n=1 Tax=Patiria miniata TaxID=46514 RepID=A0A914A8V9_PATMI|nr:development-specific protein LVN1.2-like [Patiria miniata]XP_038059861.1 development-specific protein LVN1.2-like [Patiria miniata]
MSIKSVVFLLLVVVATSYAQTKCCCPDQFEMNEGVEVGMSQAGKGSAVFESVRLAFDYTNKRIGEIGTVIIDGEASQVQVILDYNKGVGYSIDLKTKQCQKMPVPGPMLHCVPDNATYQETVYLGDHKLTVDSFGISFKTGTASLSVSKTDCIPNSFNVIGQFGETALLAVTGFYNYSQGIKNPSKYFTVPDYCPKSFTEEPVFGNRPSYKLFS